jgi:bacterioferritin-associated ferredoxin
MLAHARQGKPLPHPRRISDNARVRPAGTLTRRSVFAVANFLAILGALVSAGCAHRGRPAAPEANLVFRDPDGTEVARGWAQLPPRLPGPGKAFGGAFHLANARGDFPNLASDRYAAFISEGGDSITANLNPGVADHNVTLEGRIRADEVRGTWALSTFGGVPAERDLRAGVAEEVTDARARPPLHLGTTCGQCQGRARNVLRAVPSGRATLRATRERECGRNVHATPSAHCER